MISRERFLRRVVAEINKLEPTAKVYLYGSRARGNATEDSDWDFLILLDREVNPSITDRIRHHLYEIEWETDTVISSIIRDQRFWHSPTVKQTPFYQAVETDAIRLSA
ncbi:MAG: nucleotidyltransferase domain-containing protein [Cyanobacteria bacterium P01_F01_bin.3]